MYEVDRTRRVAELIKRELASLISKNLGDTRINNVSITGVKVSRDLRNATIYVSVIDGKQTPQEIEKHLNHSSKYLRHQLSQNISTRITPALKFKYDDSIRRGVEMTQLIDKLNKRSGA